MGIPAHEDAKRLAAEKWPGRADGDIPLTNMKRKAFNDGFVAGRITAPTAWRGRDDEHFI